MSSDSTASNPEGYACPNCEENLFDDCIDCGKQLNLIGAHFCPFCAYTLKEPDDKDTLLEPWRSLGAKATLRIGAKQWHAIAAALAVATTIGIALGTLILGILRAQSTWLQGVYFVLILLVLAAAVSVSSLLEKGIKWPVQFERAEPPTEEQPAEPSDPEPTDPPPPPDENTPSAT